MVSENGPFMGISNARFILLVRVSVQNHARPHHPCLQMVLSCRVLHCAESQSFPVGMVCNARGRKTGIPLSGTRYPHAPPQLGRDFQPSSNWVRTAQFVLIPSLLLLSCTLQLGTFRTRLFARVLGYCLWPLCAGVLHERLLGRSGGSDGEHPRWK